jgi:hypothetical protein
MLLQCGADTATSASGCTPLHAAACRGHSRLVQILLQRGTKPGAVGNIAITPLHLAAACGHSAAVKILLQSGSNERMKSEHGDSPLGLACANGHLMVVQAFVDHGTDVSLAATSGGLTALQLALEAGHEDIATCIWREEKRRGQSAKQLAPSSASGVQHFSPAFSGTNVAGTPSSGLSSVLKMTELMANYLFDDIATHGATSKSSSTETSGRASMVPHTPISIQTPYGIGIVIERRQALYVVQLSIGVAFVQSAYARKVEEGSALVEEGSALVAGPLAVRVWVKNRRVMVQYQPWWPVRWVLIETVRQYFSSPQPQDEISGPCAILNLSRKRKAMPGRSGAIVLDEKASACIGADDELLLVPASHLKQTCPRYSFHVSTSDSYSFHVSTSDSQRLASSIRTIPVPVHASPDCGPPTYVPASSASPASPASCVTKTTSLSPHSSSPLPAHFSPPISSKLSFRAVSSTPVPNYHPPANTKRDATPETDFPKRKTLDMGTFVCTPYGMGQIQTYRPDGMYIVLLLWKLEKLRPGQEFRSLVTAFLRATQVWPLGAKPRGIGDREPHNEGKSRDGHETNVAAEGARTEQRLCAGGDESEEVRMLARIAKAHRELSNWQQQRADREKGADDTICKADALWARVTEQGDMAAWQAQRNLCKRNGAAVIRPQFELPTLEKLLHGTKLECTDGR